MKFIALIPGLLLPVLAACATAATATPALETSTPVPVTEAPGEALPAESGPALVAIGTGSRARYIVGEQLARQDLPNVAIGETAAVTGSISLDATGRVNPDTSRVSVNLQGLTSDEDRRDRFLRGNALDSNQFPQAEVAVRELPGLPWPLPTSGEASFQLVGDLTVRGETRPVTWAVTARFSPDAVSGRATTSVTFDQFNMDKPSLFFIVSVNDQIDLELDFEAALQR